jgi:hypothetical protein
LTYTKREEALDKQVEKLHEEALAMFKFYLPEDLSENVISYVGNHLDFFNFYAAMHGLLGMRAYGRRSKNMVFVSINMNKVASARRIRVIYEPFLRKFLRQTHKKGFCGITLNISSFEENASYFDHDHVSAESTANDIVSAVGLLKPMMLSKV